jgi:hypothetical protein
VGPWGCGMDKTISKTYARRLMESKPTVNEVLIVVPHPSLARQSSALHGCAGLRFGVRPLEPTTLEHLSSNLNRLRR